MRKDSGKQTHIITTRRITSGEELKQEAGWLICEDEAWPLSPQIHTGGCICSDSEARMVSNGEVFVLDWREPRTLGPYRPSPRPAEQTKKRREEPYLLAS